jgi:hypothetical protein
MSHTIKVPALALAVFSLSIPLTHVQSSRLAFEVASIKPHQGPVSRIGLSISGTLVTVAAETLSNLVFGAYEVDDYQVDGATGWMTSDRYGAKYRGR